MQRRPECPSRAAGVQKFQLGSHLAFRMSGRPLPPGWPIPTWAPDANYPAGSDPWSGLPTKVAHPGAASVGFTPKRGVPAQCVNAALADAYDANGDAKMYLSTLLDWTGQDVVNFPVSATTSGLMSIVLYDKNKQTWAGIGGQDFFVKTKDPYVWAASTEISGGALLAGNYETYDFDVAPDGSIVIANRDTMSVDDAYQERNGAGAWTKQIGNLGAGSYFPNVRYAVTAAKWCWVARDEADHPAVWTSTNRIAWTSRTAPTGLPDPDAAIILTVAADGASVLIMQAYSGTNTYFSKSTDGGVTWSAAVTKALGFTPSGTYRSRPVWNGSYWLAHAVNTSTHKTRVFKSTDGLTWTQVADLANVGLVQIAALGELWMALSDASDAQVLVSTDAGTTWKFTDRAFASATKPIRVVSSDNRFLCAGVNSVCFPGFGAGKGGTAAT